MTYTYTKRTGFTLAEVLITLGIIGVVAALTIPTLISTYKKKVVETRMAKFYSTMNQAIKLSEVDNGEIMQWDKLNKGYVTDEDGNPDYSKPFAEAWYNKYLKQYLKVSKIEVTNNSISGYLKLYMPDGSLVVLSANSILFFPYADDFKEKASSTNPDLMNTDPEASGTKYFTFLFGPWDTVKANKYHYQKGMEPYMYDWDGTVDKLKNDSALGCKKEVSNERAYCAKLIQMNGWKIPDDYPLKF